MPPKQELTRKNSLFAKMGDVSPKGENFKEKMTQEASNPIKLLTKEEIQQALPAQLRMTVTDEFVDQMNEISKDPHTAEYIRDNFLGYHHVLKEGRFKLSDYLSAVAYVSYKLMGLNNTESYKLTFPKRWAEMGRRGKTDKDMSSFVVAYNKNKLVNMILEQSITPSWVLNRDLHQKALYTQAELMMTAKSEMVRTQAANSILNALKQPETAKVEMDIAVTDRSGIAELQDSMMELARRQQEAIEGGVTTKSIAAQSLYVKPEEDIEDAEIIE